MQIINNGNGAFIFLETEKERAALKVIFNYWLLKEESANQGKPRSSSYQCADELTKGLA